MRVFGPFFKSKQFGNKGRHEATGPKGTGKNCKMMDGLIVNGGKAKETKKRCLTCSVEKLFDKLDYSDVVC